MSTRIKVFDTTLRDGEQSPGASMSVDQKVEMAIALERIGVDRLEAGFPVSSPVQFNAVRQIAQTLQSTTIVALARAVKADIDAVYEATKDAKSRMLHMFLATSPLHREFKLKKSKKQILQTIAEKLTYARATFDQIEFSAEDASRTEPDFLFEVIRTAIGHGATTINIPDTVGYAIPDEFGRLIQSIRLNVPEVKTVDLSIHCHNDLGLAVANSLAAIVAGATQVEVTLNGIGERAGNCSLEELVMALFVRKDILDYTTGIKTERMYPASKLLQTITGLIIPRNKPIFGDNAFSHESGIHQDGVLKHRETYEIMSPEKIGRTSETLILGRHSGKHSFQDKLNQYNIKLNPEQFEKAFERFSSLADKKKEVYDEDIFDIVSHILGRIPTGYQLVDFNCHTGNSLMPTATVKIRKEDEEFVASTTGDGPIDALFMSIESAIGLKTKLKEYIIQAIGSGKDAQGQVKLILEIDGQNYVGRGSSTDIIEASAIAHINAINRHYLRKSKGEWTPRVLYSKWPCEDVI